MTRTKDSTENDAPKADEDARRLIVIDGSHHVLGVVTSMDLIEATFGARAKS